MYAIYYQGAFPAYSAIYQSNPNLPIYVGKAVPTGWRQGRAKRRVNDFTEGSENTPGVSTHHRI